MAIFIPTEHRGPQLALQHLGAIAMHVAASTSLAGTARRCTTSNHATWITLTLCTEAKDLSTPHSLRFIE